MRRVRRAAALSGASLGAALAFAPAAEAADFTVSNNLDAGAGSLRQAILDAEAVAGADRILFAASVTGTITLTTGELEITEALDVVGPGAGVLTVSGNDSSRIFYVDGVPGENISISGLRLTDGSESIGGGISFEGGPNRLILSQVELTSNEAVTDGGAIGVFQGTLRVEDSTISGNSADTGAGIAISGGLLRLEGTTVSGNNASEAAGGISAFAGVGRIENSTISGNTAGPLAPGIGGGIVTYLENEFTIESSTVAGNSATTTGGGMAAVLNAQNPILHNTIVAGNTAASEPEISAKPFPTPAPIDASYSLIGSTAGATINETVPGSNILNQGAGLAPLAANGGLTQTQAITEASLAFDAGDPDDFPATDQRGILRPQFTAPDIGAFELEDTVAPKAKLKKKPKKKTKTSKSKAKVTFKFKSNEKGSTFECKLKGGKGADKQFAPCESPKSYRLKSKGGKGKKYTFSVKATDATGNVGDAKKATFSVIRNGK